MHTHTYIHTHIYTTTMSAYLTRLDPHPDWIITQSGDVQSSSSSSINFPQLYYYRINGDSLLNLPFNKNSLGVAAMNNDIVCGGSYNIYINTPLFAERCLIFEDLYFPYNINSKYIKVRYGALLWPRINLDAYTYLSDPRRVFLKKHNKFVAEFRFYKDRIELYECVGA